MLKMRSIQQNFVQATLLLQNKIRKWALKAIKIFYVIAVYHMMDPLQDKHLEQLKESHTPLSH